MRRRRAAPDEHTGSGAAGRGAADRGGAAAPRAVWVAWTVRGVLVAAGLTVPLTVAAGVARAHDWGEPSTDAGEALAPDPGAGDPRVAAAGRDAGLVPGLEGPAEWAVFAFVGLLVTLAVFVILAMVAKVAYRFVAATGSRVGWVASKLPVSDRRVRVAVVAFLAFGAVAFVGLEVQDSTTSLWDSESGAAGRANDLKERGLKGDPVGSLDADAVLTGDTYSGPPYDRPTPDTDGDRLKDSWERAGVTPWGAELPGADPDHKDLYVQVNYGANVSAYTAAEKRALRRSWERMPVDNPDGEQGIRLHLVEGDRLPTTPTFDAMSSDEMNRFYDREHLGPRMCVYHQVVVGRVDLGNTVGVAGVPGYTSAVDGRRADFDGNTTRRVHVTNHELLHNTVGTLGTGGSHTARGWLSPEVDPDDDHLSSPAAAALDEGITGSGYFQHEVCERGGATATATAAP